MDKMWRRHSWVKRTCISLLWGMSNLERNCSVSIFQLQRRVTKENEGHYFRWISMWEHSYPRTAKVFCWRKMYVFNYHWKMIQDWILIFCSGTVVSGCQLGPSGYWRRSLSSSDFWDRRFLYWSQEKKVGTVIYWDDCNRAELSFLYVYYLTFQTGGRSHVNPLGVPASSINITSENTYYQFFYYRSVSYMSNFHSLCRMFFVLVISFSCRIGDWDLPWFF